MRSPLGSRRDVFGCAGDKIALKSNYGYIAVAEFNNTPYGNCKWAEEMCTFTVQDLGRDEIGDKIAFITYNNNYIIAESRSSYKTIVNRKNCSTWEKTFYVERQNNGTFTLKTWRERYVVANPNGGLTAAGTNAESFYVECMKVILLLSCIFSAHIHLLL